MTAPVRTSFFEEQATHRRRTFRFAVFAVLTVALAGIPVSLIVTPILFLVTLTVAHLINLATPIPREFWDAVSSAGRLLPEALGPLDRGINHGDWAAVDWTALGRLGLLLVVPGMVFMVVLWVWVRALFWHAGPGGVLLSIGARDPRPHDLEERQIANLLEEMSIAAGIRPPRIAILDQETPNAALVGARLDDATIVVTRGLLDQLDRDQTQAVLGHLIGSACNGDLRIAMLLLSVNQTFGLLATILAAGSARKARRALWGSVRGLFVRDDRATQQIADLLEADHDLDDRPNQGGVNGAIKAPFILAAACTTFLISIGQMMFFGPFLAAMWRARRFLADATAVKLTRNPDGMTQALQVLSRSAVRFARGDSASLMFIDWPSGSRRDRPSEPMGGWHPSMAKRMHRMVAVGGKLIRSDRDATDRPKRSIIGRILVGLLMVFVYALFAVGIVAMLVGGVLVMAITLMITGLALYLIHQFFLHLPGMIHWARFDAVPLFKKIAAAIEHLIATAKK